MSFYTVVSSLSLIDRGDPAGQPVPSTSAADQSAPPVPITSVVGQSAPLVSIELVVGRNVPILLQPVIVADLDRFSLSPHISDVVSDKIYILHFAVQ